MSIVLITGANRGIGFGIAQAVASRIPSTTIILGCRNIANGHEAIERLRKLGVSSTLDAVQIDIEDIQSITAAVEALHNRYGKLDVLINNAASLQLPEAQHLAELKDCSDRNFNSCVTSNALVTKAFVPLLRKSSWPRVIMNSSARGSLGRTANRELPPVALIDYCVCKAALNMLTLHYQIIEDNHKGGGESITFWSVSPGHTRTAFNNYRGKKDPVASAEAFVRLLESDKGAIRPGTFWDFEDGKFQEVPW
ncbi:NAD(P)-binding protein [Trichoderma aethiopicum]